jgi:hypothetical protein
MHGVPKQFDVVTLQRVPPLDAEEFLKTNRRLPRIGDVRTILEIYSHPHLAYEVTCCEPDGYHTEWEHAFDASELWSFFAPYLPDHPR